MPCAIQQNDFLPAAAKVSINISGAFNRCHSIGLSMDDQGRSRNLGQAVFRAVDHFNKVVDGKEENLIINQISSGGTFSRLRLKKRHQPKQQYIFRKSHHHAPFSQIDIYIPK